MIMLECLFSALVDLVQEVGEDSVRHILDVDQETLNLRIRLLLVRLEVHLNTHLDVQLRLHLHLILRSPLPLQQQETLKPGLVARQSLRWSLVTTCRINMQSSAT